MSNSSKSGMLEFPAPAATELEDVGRALKVIMERLIRGDESITLEAIPFTEWFTPLVKLYAAASERAGRELTAVTTEATPTEVVMLACALIRAQDLTPFDLALWFSRAGHKPQPH
jgi:hypothetical protein